MGFLDEGHRCPGGVGARVFKALLTVSIGAAIGIAIVYVLEERPPVPLWMAGAALGAVLAVSMRQAIGVR
jgi:hypothetical protein